MSSLEEGNYEDDDQQPYQQNDSQGHQMGFTSTVDRDYYLIR